MLWVVVFDTNVLISALLSSRGAPFHCLALARSGIIESVTCEPILQEFRSKLLYKFDHSAAVADAAVDEVRSFSRVVEFAGELEVVSNDPDDNKVIECAVAGGATHIVSGDTRHLLPIGTYEGIEIVRPADLLARVTA